MEAETLKLMHAYIMRIFDACCEGIKEEGLKDIEFDYCKHVIESTLIYLESKRKQKEEK